MEAVFYSFSKRRNSTKQPTGGTTIDVNLKAVTDMRSPILVLSYQGIPAFNYFSLDGKYYWIDSIESIRDNVWAIHGRIDVLASFKADILNTTAFVVYDTTANSEIVDGRIPIKTSVTRARSFATLNPAAESFGSIIITCQGYDGCNSYIIGYNYLQDLLNQVNPWMNDKFDNLVDPNDPITTLANLYLESQKLTLGMGNVLENIKNIIIVPFNVSGSYLKEITLGAFNTGIYGAVVTDTPVQSNVTSISIPWQSSGWRRKSPYTELSLYLPFVGTVSLSPDSLIGVSSLSIKTSVNKLSGAVSYEVEADNNTILVTGANAGYQIPFGSLSLTISDITASLSQVMNAAPALVSGNFGAIASIANQMSGTLAGTYNSVGGASGGAGAGLGLTAECCVTYHDTIAEPSTYNDLMGSPSMVVKSLATLTGYVQTDHFNLSKDTLSANIDEVNTLMDGGVYIE